MSQLFLATGPNTDEIKHLLSRGLDLFRGVAKISPLKVIEVEGLALAVFDSTARAGSARVFDAGQGWCAAVGSWFYDRQAQGDLAPLVRAAERSDDALIQSLDHCDGFFGLVVATGGRVDVITDPLGRLHLYEAQWRSTRLVSTSSLVLAALMNASWNPMAIREFLALGYVLGEHSLFEGIRKLEPASVTSQRLMGDHEPTRRTYWRVSDWVYDGSRQPVTDSVDRLAQSLRKSVHDVFAAYQRPAMDLTGGFDSRALLGAALREHAAERIAAVVSGPKTSPDVVSAKAIAERYSLHFSRRDSEPPDTGRWWGLAQQALPLVDGEYDVLEYASILNIHAALAERFDVSVNGSGGEVCRGYWWELLVPFIGWRGHFDPARVASARFATDAWAEDRLAAQFEQPLAQQIAGTIDDAGADLTGQLNTARMDNVYLALRMHRWQGRIASASGRLWPCCSPFLMKEPLQVALGAPVSRRMANRMVRQLIQTLDPQLAAMPLASGLPAAPITWRTAARYRRLPAQWAARAARKACRPVAAKLRTPSESGTGLAARFFQHADFTDWWSAGPVTENLYKDDVLAQLMSDNPPVDLVQPSHFGRMVTLELVARMVKGAQ